LNGAVNAPRIISWNITLRPPLKCSHCYVDAGEDETDGVLSTHEAFSVIDQVRAIGTPVVILSGGEPLLREDVYAIARYGTEQGLRMIMEYFAANPKVSVEIEEYAPDLSVFSFVSLQGTP
jgi:MoaA/NifB/PqqE/SkfB family radical SAM enzyme